MIGYLIGTYKKYSPELTLDALFTIKLLDNSRIIDKRKHEIYDTILTDKAEIINIQSVCNIDNPSVNSELYNGFIKDFSDSGPITVGNILRIKYADLSHTSKNCIKFYSTKTGALNDSSYIHPNFKGSKIYFYPSGKIKKIIYCENGIKESVSGYYDNEMNSLKYVWTFFYNNSTLEEQVCEVIYNTTNNPVCKIIITDNKIVERTDYDRSTYVRSFYLGEKIPPPPNTPPPSFNWTPVVPPQLTRS